MTVTIDPAARPAIAHPALHPAAIRAARTSIPAAFLDSPQFLHAGLSRRAGADIVLKVESVNPIGSFKGRGTWLAVHGLAERGAIGGRRPVTAASTGNFGQGVAFAAARLGVDCVIFANKGANPLKLERMRMLGADLRLHGLDFDAAREAATTFARVEGLTMLVDGQDTAIATGAATLAVELTDAAERGEIPTLANAYVPVGNGSLVVGVASWLRATAPGCRVVGVQSDAAPAMTLSWRAGRPIETETALTSADGIATRVAIPEALALLDGRVDEMLLVSEEAIEAARIELTAATGLMVEPSAAASWAGLLADTGRRGGASLVIVTGTNVAPR